MTRVNIYLQYLQPSSLEEAIALFFPAERRRTAIKVWKWFTRNRVAHPLLILELAVELTGDANLMKHYRRLLMEADDPLSYDEVLKLKEKLIEIATELGVNFEKVLDDVEYAISVMRALGVLHPMGGLMVYNPTWLTHFLRRIAREIEREYD